MPPQALLEGRAEPDEVTALRRRIEQLENLRDDALEELTKTQIALRDARQESATAKRAVSALRDQLKPLYQSLRQLFGEIDAISGGQSSVERNSNSSAVWESWKSKLGGKQAEFIAALLEHGEMTAVQLKVATHSGSSTVPQIIYKLNKLGLIHKNGGKYSLKDF